MGAANYKDKAYPRVRTPIQARSRRSLERMLDAAAALIARNGVESLTVADVVQRGDSSVGAFYARFADKDALVREVQDRFVRQCEERMFNVVTSLDVPRVDLDTAVTTLTKSVAILFREHGSLISAFIRQAGRDEVLRLRADNSFHQLARRVGDLFARRFAKPFVVAETFVRIITATFEQYVCTEEKSRWTDWDTLTRELERAASAYLR
jgi:AcrR family transcriptional regulator